MYYLLTLVELNKNEFVLLAILISLLPIIVTLLDVVWRFSLNTSKTRDEVEYSTLWYNIIDEPLWSIDGWGFLGIISCVWSLANLLIFAIIKYIPSIVVRFGYWMASPFTDTNTTIMPIIFDIMCILFITPVIFWLTRWRARRRYKFQRALAGD